MHVLVEVDADLPLLLLLLWCCLVWEQLTYSVSCAVSEGDVSVG